MARACDLRLALACFWLLSLLCFCSCDDSLFLGHIDGREGRARGDLHSEPTEKAANAAQEGHVCEDEGIASSFEEEGLQNLCPVSCFRPDPVCGEDGVTYWCGCREARCARVSVLHVGFCKIRSSASIEKGSQALLLLHALWLGMLGFSCLFGLL